MIEISGIDEIIKKFNAAPEKFKTMALDGMSDSLDVIHEAVQPYPAPPSGSKYVRTGRLGASMGSSMGGGVSGAPNIETIKIGSNYIEGKFGSSLSYAEYVIGDGTQAEVHQGRWWTVATLAGRAASKVISIWQRLTDRWAEWINNG
jgi:hypothetical protein